ncbi:MAG: 30S ribosome-binding factor RbfA [Bdellovibrionales bacterium]
MKPNDVREGPSQRQLRVGEELRHALSEILNRGDSNEPELFDVSITVTEVRVSPDLRNATVFVMPLGGKDLGPIMEALKRTKPFFRHQVAKELKNLRNVPDLRFEADNSFDTSKRIDDILKNI